MEPRVAGYSSLAVLLLAGMYMWINPGDTLYPSVPGLPIIHYPKLPKQDEPQVAQMSTFPKGRKFQCPHHLFVDKHHCEAVNGEHTPLIARQCHETRQQTWMTEHSNIFFGRSDFSLYQDPKTLLTVCRSNLALPTYDCHDNRRPNRRCEFHGNNFSYHDPWSGHFIKFSRH